MCLLVVSSVAEPVLIASVTQFLQGKRERHGGHRWAEQRLRDGLLHRLHMQEQGMWFLPLTGGTSAPLTSASLTADNGGYSL